MAQGSTKGVPIDTDITLAADSDLVVPSQKAVRAYIAALPGTNFTSNIPVILSGGKTLGRYANGSTIPSNGLTAQQVITLLAQEPVAPTVSLSTTTGTRAFNQTTISNVLNFSYTINTYGASVGSVSLQWARVGASPQGTGGATSWVEIANSTSLTTFTHNISQGDTAFNTNSFYYRYIVTDSNGLSTTSSTVTILTSAYSAPTITFSAPAVSKTSPETDTTREWGNTPSTLQGSCSRNSVNVPISAYQYSVSVNGGAYSNIGSSTSLSASGGSFTTTSDTQATSTTTSITYRVQVTDSYTTTTATYSINLYSMMFYGAVSQSSTINSALIRSLTRRFIISGSPFTFSTGTTYTRMIVAMDNTHTLTDATDITINASVDFTTDTRSISVNDAAGNAKTYNVYVNSFGVAYNPADTIQITYS
jgi:hypothetical protein